MSAFKLYFSMHRTVIALSAALLLAGPPHSAFAETNAANNKESAEPKKDTGPAGETDDDPKPKKEPKTKPKPADETNEEAADTASTDEKTSGEKPVDPDDEAAAENAEAEAAAVARPVAAEPIQIFGWREYILVDGVEEKLKAKLDTGALTSSIHAEEKELFERDGKKWVRFIVTDPGVKKPTRTRVEAPLVRIARIKDPGAESQPREVVRLSIQIGERRMRGEFTLNNRSNMLAPVLIGRNMIKDLGWVDATRVNLADKKILR